MKSMLRIAAFVAGLAASGAVPAAETVDMGAR
jgi:hypothetical protein